MRVWMMCGFLVTCITTLCLVASVAGEGDSEPTATASVNEAQKSESPKFDLKKMQATVERLGKKVEVSFIDAPLGDILEVFGKQNRLEFDTGNETLPNEAISFDLRGGQFGDVLQQILKQCEWTYAVRPDGKIFLHPIPNPKKPAGESAPK